MKREAVINRTFDAAGMVHGDLLEEIAKLKAERDRLRQLVRDCQADLASYLPPDSGISEHAVVSKLLERLDGGQARAALGDAP